MQSCTSQIILNSSKKKIDIQSNFLHLVNSKRAINICDSIFTIITLVYSSNCRFIFLIKLLLTNIK